MKQAPEVLRHVFEALKPGGRLVVADYMPLKTKGRTRDEQTKNHVIASELVEPELRGFGFHILERVDNFIDRDEERILWLLVAEKPAFD